jgi:hypothetical protein
MQKRPTPFVEISNREIYDSLQSLHHKHDEMMKEMIEHRESISNIKKVGTIAITTVITAFTVVIGWFISHISSQK